MLERLKGIRTTMFMSFLMILVFTSLWLDKFLGSEVVSLIQVLVPSYLTAKVGFKFAEKGSKGAAK